MYIHWLNIVLCIECCYYISYVIYYVIMSYIMSYIMLLCHIHSVDIMYRMLLLYYLYYNMIHDIS